MIIHQAVTRVVYPLLHSRHNVVGIIECGAGKKPRLLQKLARAVYDVVNPRYTTLNKLAQSHRIPYYCMSNGSDDQLADWVKSLAPDVIAIHTMNQLLKPNIFSIPRYGTINLHQSYLPEYRGRNPDFWHYHDMQLHPGVTVHYIDQGEDTGDIIYQARTTIAPGTRSADYLDKLVGEVGVPLLLKALDAIATASAPRHSQPKTSPTVRARKLKPEEHQHIIDWNGWEIERIWHLLRGTEQFFNAIDPPGGWLYKGQRWKIGEFIRCDMSGYRPSAIYREQGCCFVACRDGKIFLNKCFLLKRFLSRFW